jgi:HEAT repeat protein
MTKLDTTAQPELFYFEDDTSLGSVELFPAVWQAAEKLTSAKEEIRHTALDELLQLNAPRFSPLVVYVLSTRLRDSSLSFRARVIETLANVLRVDIEGKLAPNQVREHLVSYLAQLENDEIVAILEVGIKEKESKSHIAKLLNFCPQAGKFLSEVLADRSALIEIRQIAAFYIGQIGFVEAISTLERLRNRLESRPEGQKSMPFAPPSISEEANLLPEIKSTLSLLQTSYR